jgi:hypothetical protein
MLAFLEFKMIEGKIEKIFAVFHNSAFPLILGC